MIKHARDENDELVAFSNETMPEMLVNAIKALSYKMRREIVAKLIEHGQLTYTGIARELNVEHRQVIAPHLKKLVLARLVGIPPEQVGENQRESPYIVTAFGKSFMKAIYASLSGVE